ncbi:hypothetical protein [Phaeovulum vinaykumarii]|uniref:Uncharacterized protein n=1 Tax=Phaeovulum vinaykumarii TaxID=407234 RepID=A0A1N7MFM0_9RHOB|nr:hypothetical protein [Phaeovulum vinaykumarii]SIS84832.1 hypothetical protein SAMN05421795_10758 [Phaeovulum vinaykumarii]SOC11965.1 hypothetical protein SAMN05878426_10758 [Phaeovulum vinaykumarii]
MLGLSLGLRARPRRRAAGPPLPSGALAFYDPANLATLWQDAAGTVPVTADGDPVGRMLDLSGNGHHLSQPVAAKRPTYRTDGTRHWIESDGVDDALELPSRLGLAVNPALSVTCALRGLGAKAEGRVWELGAGLGSLSGGLGTDGWSWRYNNGNILYAPTPPGVDGVATWMHPAGGNYVSSQLWLGGAQLAQVSAVNPAYLPTNTNPSFRLCNGGSSGTTAGQLRLYAVVVRASFDRAAAAADEAWAGVKAGVSP